MVKLMATFMIIKGDSDALARMNVIVYSSYKYGIPVNKVLKPPIWWSSWTHHAVSCSEWLNSYIDHTFLFQVNKTILKLSLFVYFAYKEYSACLLWWLMSHVTFAKTLLVSIWFFDKFKERESHSALFHGKDAMYNLRRWPPEKVLESNVLDINNHKFWLSTFVNRNAIHCCNRKFSHLKGSETSEANNSRVTRARLLRLQIWKGEYKIGNWKHTKSSTAE